MHILVIGGGYLGSGIARSLNALNHEVTLFSRSPINDEAFSGIKQINGDICDQNSVTVLSQLKFDAAIYTISLDQSASEKNVSQALDINVKPLWLLLEACKEKQSLFIYLSTIQVYGKLQSTVTEKQTPLPLNHYGLTHLIAENILKRYQSESLYCTSLRLSNSYGPPVVQNTKCWSLVINDLCRSVSQNQRIDLLSDGTPLRNFIFNEDVHRVIALLLLQPRSATKFSYNVVGETTNSILEVAQVVATEYERKTSCKVPIYLKGGELAQPEITQKLTAKKFTIDSARIAKLGFKPKFSLNAGINLIFNSLQEKSK